MRYIINFKYLLSRFYRNLFLAIKGQEMDYTSGSINRAIFMLSVPMVLEMVLESVFAVVDIFFVGKISTNAVATVGLTESVITIVYSIAIGLSIATTAVVARRIGEKEPKKAAVAAFQSMIIAFVISGVIGVRYSHLVEGGHQINMFEDTEETCNLYQAMDQVRNRYGQDAVKRAVAMGSKAIGRFNPFTGEPPMVPAHRRA